MEFPASEKATPTLLVCTGDACEDVGARDLIKLARRKGSETVKCKSTGCLGCVGKVLPSQSQTAWKVPLKSTEL